MEFQQQQNSFISHLTDIAVKNTAIVNILKNYQILNNLWNLHIKTVLYLVLNVNCKYSDSLFILFWKVENTKWPSLPIVSD